MSDMIEKELLAATGLRMSKSEKRQVFLTRLMRAASKLEDEPWEALSKEAQDWCNDAITAFKNGQEVPDFVPPEAPADEEDQAPEDSVSEDITEDGEIITKPKKKAEVVAKPKKSATPMRKLTATHLIKRLVINEPSISVNDLIDRLKDEGFKVSGVTVATLRSDTRDTLRVLNELQMGQFDLNT
jgi:hypothetical protein